MISAGSEIALGVRQVHWVEPVADEGPAGSDDCQNQWASGEVESARILDVGNLDLEGDTILVEARRMAYQGNPVQGESLEDQIAD